MIQVCLITVRPCAVRSAPRSVVGRINSKGRLSMRAFATWCVRHRRMVVTGWLTALIGLSLLSHSVGSSYKDSFSLNGTQSYEALQLLQQVAPKASGDREQVVVSV